MRKNSNPARDAAIKSGLKRYFSGIACRNGHVAERYVSTGECIDCLKKHKPTKDRKRATFLRMKERKSQIDPGWRAKAMAAYRKRHPLKARIEKLFKTARLHAAMDSVQLDFDIDFVRDKLQIAIEGGFVIAEPHSPLTASLDKIDVTKPISRLNMQIAPWWYNRAKWRWSESDLTEAMRRFGFVRQ